MDSILNKIAMYENHTWLFYLFLRAFSYQIKNWNNISQSNPFHTVYCSYDKALLCVLLSSLVITYNFAFTSTNS